MDINLELGLSLLLLLEKLRVSECHICFPLVFHAKCLISFALIGVFLLPYPFCLILLLSCIVLCTNPLCLFYLSFQRCLSLCLSLCCCRNPICFSLCCCRQSFYLCLFSLNPISLSSLSSYLSVCFSLFLSDSLFLFLLLSSHSLSLSLLQRCLSLSLLLLSLNSLLFSLLFICDSFCLGLLFSFFEFPCYLFLFFLNLFSLSLLFCQALSFFLLFDLFSSLINLDLGTELLLGEVFIFNEIECLLSLIYFVLC